MRRFFPSSLFFYDAYNGIYRHDSEVVLVGFYTYAYTETLFNIFNLWEIDEIPWVRVLATQVLYEIPCWPQANCLLLAALEWYCGYGNTTLWRYCMLVQTRMCLDFFLSKDAKTHQYHTSRVFNGLILQTFT